MLKSPIAERLADFLIRPDGRVWIFHRRAGEECPYEPIIEDLTAGRLKPMSNRADFDEDGGDDGGFWTGDIVAPAESDAVESSNTGMLGSRAFLATLERAIGATLTLADSLPQPVPAVSRLSAAAGYLLQGESSLQRLGRTAGLNSIHWFTSQIRTHPALSGTADEALIPVAALISDVLAAAEPTAAKDQRAWRARNIALARAWYLGEPEGITWPHREALARVEYARAELEHADGAAAFGETLGVRLSERTQRLREAANAGSRALPA